MAFSNCHDYANKLLEVKASDIRHEVLNALDRTSKFLFRSRQGFYCSLCDADSHHFYDQENEEISVNYQFCSELVENTLNFLVFRYDYFVKLSRLYSEFLATCDSKGKFNKTKAISVDNMFFRNEAILTSIQACQQGHSQGALRMAWLQ